jgi:hypothetical protein
VWPARGTSQTCTLLPPARWYLRATGGSSGTLPAATRSTGRGAIRGTIPTSERDGFMPEMARSDWHAPVQESPAG